MPRCAATCSPAPASLLCASRLLGMHTRCTTPPSTPVHTGHPSPHRRLLHPERKVCSAKRGCSLSMCSRHRPPPAGGNAVGGRPVPADAGVRQWWVLRAAAWLGTASVGGTATWPAPHTSCSPHRHAMDAVMVAGSNPVCMLAPAVPTVQPKCLLSWRWLHAAGTGLSCAARPPVCRLPRPAAKGQVPAGLCAPQRLPAGRW